MIGLLDTARRADVLVEFVDVDDAVEQPVVSMVGRRRVAQLRLVKIRPSSPITPSWPVPPENQSLP